MLPSLKNIPTEVISVKGMGTDLHLPDNKMMKEFMKRHFPDASFKVLKGLAETEIVNYLKRQKGNALVALGAYRRGMVSRWFKPSMADALLKELKFPLFIFLIHFSASTAWNTTAAIITQISNSVIDSGWVLKMLFAKGK